MNAVRIALGVLLLAGSAAPVAIGQEEEQQAQELDRLVEEVVGNDREASVAAWRKLEELGPKAAPVAPLLVRQLAGGFLDETQIVFVLGILESTGPLALPAILEALSGEGELQVMVPETESRLLYVVGNYGEKGAPAIPLLTDKLRKSWSQEVRDYAASALASIGRQALPVLLQSMKSEVDGERSAAASALTSIKDPPMEVLALCQGRLDDSVDSIRRSCARVLLGQGEAGVRILVERLGDADEKLRGILLFELSSPPADFKASSAMLPLFVPMLDSPDADIRKVAVGLLARLGDGARSVVPRLAERLRGADAGIAGEILAALFTIAPDEPVVVACLFEATASQDRGLRESAIALTAKLPSGTPGLLEVLSKALQQATDFRSAALAAEGLMAQGEAGVTALVAALDDGAAQGEHRRLAVAEALTEQDRLPEPLASAVARRLDDSSFEVRKAAAVVCLKLGLESERSLENLVRTEIELPESAPGDGPDDGADVEDPNVRLAPRYLNLDTGRRELAEIHDRVRSLGWESSRLLETLRPLLSHRDPWVRAPAAYLLTYLGGEDVQVVQLLSDVAVSDENPTVRLVAVDALMSRAMWLPGAWGSLGEELKIPELTGLHGGLVAVALHHGGVRQPGVVKAVGTLLCRPELRYRRLAIDTLSTVDSGSLPALDALAAALEDKDLYVAFWAAATIGAIGPDAAKAVPNLKQALGSDRKWLRQAAAYALGRIGAPAEAAIPALCKAWRDEFPPVRLNAVFALSRIDPGRKDARAILLQALVNEEDGVRDLAVEALRQQISNADELFPELLRVAAQGRKEAFWLLNPGLRVLSELAPHLAREFQSAYRSGTREQRVALLRAAAPTCRTGCAFTFETVALAIRDDEPDVRCAAAVLVPAFGRIPADLVAPLLRILEESRMDFENHKAVLDALVSAGPELIPELLPHVVSRSGGVFEWPFDVLVSIPGGKAAALQMFEAMLVAPSETARRTGLDGLERLGKDGAPAWIRLLGGSGNGDYWPFEKAVQALKGQGQPSVEAIPQLCQIAGDKARFGRLFAADVLAWASFRTLEPEGIDCILSLLADGDGAMQRVVMDVAAAEGIDCTVLAGPLLRDADIGRRLRGIAVVGLARDTMASAVPILETAAGDAQPQVRQAAARALMTLGADPEGVGPTLLKLLRDPEPAVRIDAARALGEYQDRGTAFAKPLAGALDDRVAGVRAAALDGLTRLPAEAVKPFLGKAKRLLRDKDGEVRSAALWLLGLRGADGGKELSAAIFKALSDPNLSVRTTAAELLRDVRLADLPPGTEALLLKLLDEPDEKRQLHAMAALHNVGPTPAAVPALARLLSSPSARCRCAASEVLGRIGPGAAAAVPALVRNLDDADEDIRRAAATALGRLGSPGLYGLLDAIAAHRSEQLTSVEEVPGYVTVSGWKAYASARELARLLDAVRRVGDEAPPLLDQAVAGADENRQYAALIALGATETSPPRHTLTFVQALSKPSADLRWAALHSLQRTKGLPEAGLAALAGALADDSPRIRFAAAVGIAEQQDIWGNRETRGAEAILVLALKEDDADRRAVAAAALCRFTNPADETVSALIAACADKEERVSELAIVALWRYGARSRSAIPTLLSIVAARDSFYARSALSEIVRGGPATPILDSMEGDPIMIAVTASDFLDKATLDAARDLDRLVRLTGHPEYSVSDAAMRAIRRLGPEAREAVPFLLKYVRTHAGLGRTEAIEALGAIGDAALPALVELLGLDCSCEGDVLRQLAQGEWSPEPTAAALAKLLNSERYAHSYELAQALVHQGASAVPHLIAALEKPATAIPEAVFYSLESLGATANAAVPALVALVRVDRGYCEKVTRTLDYILADDADSTVRQELEEQCNPEAVPREE